MRFVARIEVFLPGDVVERVPTVWDRFASIWHSVDLTTGSVRDKIEAAAFVHQFREALDVLGIDNGRALVVDGLTVFHDARDEKGDLPDLLLALSDHVRVFGESCKELRMSVQHEEAGLELVLEATVTSEHPKDAPSARIAVLGQIIELAPVHGESAEDYRARIEPFVSNQSRAAAVRLQFGAFVSRLQTAMERAFTDTRFAVTTEAIDVALAMLVRDPPPDSDPAPSSQGTSVTETAAPQRNFSLNIEQRIGALMGGPPQYAVRLRKIEDGEAEILDALRKVHGDAIPVAVARKIEEVNRLIADHNRFYPVECNLPMDVATGQLMQMGEPWLPRPPMTIDALRRRAARRHG